MGARAKGVGLLAATAYAPAVWGTSYLTTTQLLPDGRPLLIGAVRALPAGLLLLAFARRLPTGVWWWRSTALGLLNVGIFFPLVFAGAERLPGGVAATVNAVQPLVVALLAYAILGRRPAVRVLVAGLVGAAGVALLVLSSSARLDPLGVLLMLLANLSMATGVVLASKWGRPEGVSLLATTSWQLVAGGVTIVPLMLAVEGTPGRLSGRNVIGFSYLVLLGTALAYVLWFRGIDRLGPQAASFLGLVNPLTATAGGIVVLNQRLTPPQILGLVLALGAMALSQTRPRRDRATAAAPVEAPVAPRALSRT